MKRILYYLILIPVAVVAIAFALANREWVTLSLDPLNPSAPAVAIDAPLFVILFGVLIIGVLLGGIAVWFKQGRHRRAARLARNEIERQKSEMERLRGQLSAGTPGKDNHAALPSSVPL
jgi:uncharacterized integral membrane protein